MPVVIYGQLNRFDKHAAGSACNFCRYSAPLRVRRWHLDEVFVRINGELHYLWRAVDHEGEVLESFVTKRRDREATLRFMRKAMKGFGRLKLVVTDRLRATTLLTRNAIFAAAKSSKSIARPCRMASNCSLKLTGGPDFLRRPHSSDAAARSLWSTGRRIPGHSVLVGQYGECYVITRLILEEKCPNIIYRAKIMASQEKTLDDFTIDGDLFKVLVNDEGQHSLWPSAQQPPKGWKEAGCSGGKSECLEFVEKNWKDMRPISLQKQMAGN